MSKPAIADLASTGLSIPVSATRELANRVMGTPDVLPLWFGEPDVPTPQFICEAANQSMAAGNTFYVEGLGKPWFRETLAAYMSDLYQDAISASRIAVTTSGTNALNLAFQMILEPGDRVVTTLPAFPTLLTVPTLQQAELDLISLEPTDNGWQLDVDQLIARIEGDDDKAPAKAVLINSPNNPTGWVMSLEDMKRLLEASRKTGTWIVSDEVYARIVFEGRAAPSMAEIAAPEDRVIIVNSFSKSWAMTGWRLGWLTLPDSLIPVVEKLMEYSMSCAPEFVQAGGSIAVQKGEVFIQEQVKRYREGRDISMARLAQIDRVWCIPPQAAFYALFKVDGVESSVDFCDRLAREGGLGLAPGTAFDPAAEGWVRLCFAKSPELLNEAFDRLERFLAR